MKLLHTMNTKKSLFAVAIAASVFTLGAPRSAHAQFIAPFGTGYQGANGLQYNNGTSALLSVMIQNNMNMTMMRNSLNSSHFLTYGGGSRRSGATPAQLQARRGRALIKSGRATMAFKMRPAPAYLWVAEWAKKNARGRAGANAEWQAQSAIWRQAVAARGATYGDMAQMLGVAFVMCAEAYSGRQINKAGYNAKVANIRRIYLQSPGYQGWTQAEKQDLYERTLLSASWAMYLRRQGKITEARKTAGDWLADNWNTDHKGVSDADDAVATLARFQTGPLPMPSARVASTSITRAKPMPRPRVQTATTAPDDNGAPNLQAALAQAQKITRYARSTNALLPSMLAAQQPAAKREEARQFYVQLLNAGRAQMRKTFELPSNAPDDVARALTMMVSYFYVLARSPVGTGGVVVSSAQVEALQRQFTLLLGSDAKFKAQSAQQKQMMFEGAVLMTTLVGVMSAQAQKSGDLELQKQVQATAAGSLQKFLGVSPDKMRFSNAGLQF